MTKKEVEFTKETVEKLKDIFNKSRILKNVIVKNKQKQEK